jgi:Trk K+ transport system NAD-binding subunit
VVGGGKVGRAATQAMKSKGTAVHMVEREPGLEREIGKLPDRLILGDAADRSILEKAGLERAPSVVLTTNDDATNIYLSIYCRRLNPDLRIVSRITHEDNVEAIYRAGADFVLSYATLGVQSIFALLEGRELIVVGEGTDLFRIPVPARLAGSTLLESEIGARTGLNVIAIESDGLAANNPSPQTRLQKGHFLVAIGTLEQRQEFAEKFSH